MNIYEIINYYLFSFYLVVIPTFIPVIKFAFSFFSDPRDINPLFDAKEFRSPQFQRVYQYLKLSNEGKNMDNFTFVPGNIDDDQTKCLSLMLRSVKCFSLFISSSVFI